MLLALQPQYGPNCGLINERQALPKDVPFFGLNEKGALSNPKLGLCNYFVEVRLELRDDVFVPP